MALNSHITQRVIWFSAVKLLPKGLCSAFIAAYTDGMKKILSPFFSILLLSLSIKAAQTDTWDGENYKANSSIQTVWAASFFQKVNLRGNEDILDLGCGDGKITKQIALRVPNGFVHGIDLSPNQIKTAHALIDDSVQGRLSFSVGNAEDFHLDKKFDLIFSNAALHWVRDQDAVVQKSKEHLKPGGKIVFFIPAFWHLHTQRENTVQALKGTDKYAPYMNAQEPRNFPHSMDAYITRLITNGFKVDTIQLKPRDNIFASREQFWGFVNAWAFSEYDLIPANLRHGYVDDYVDTYMKQPLVLDGQKHIHYYGFTMEVYATKFQCPLDIE